MGPLQGFRIIEMGGIGPAPFCAMMLADMGADVVRVVRPREQQSELEFEVAEQVLHRGRRSLCLDLKQPDAVHTLLTMCAASDGLIEGFRPGVMESLGLGPDDCLRSNPKLIYGRLTGWGQQGPLARTAGHDINYAALSGVLALLGPADAPPEPPLNVIADMGGGGLLLAFGMVCGLLEASRSGAGQVVDAAMVDGSALMASTVFGLRALKLWSDERGRNILDGAAPFYAVYETSDGKFMAAGALESKFYTALVSGLGLDITALPEQMDIASWPSLKQQFAAVFKSRSQAEWIDVFAGSEACVTPALTLEEAANHPHNQARQTYCRAGDVLQASPAPRFSRTPATLNKPPPSHAQQADAVLLSYGFDKDHIRQLRQSGAMG